MLAAASIYGARAAKRGYCLPLNKSKVSRAKRKTFSK